jgi:hypothetical protein
MAQYMFGAIFGPKDRKPHRHLNIGGKFPRKRNKRFIYQKYIQTDPFPGVFFTRMGRYHMICVLGSFFIPKDRKPVEFLVMANKFPGNEIKASVVRNILFPTL